MNFALVLDGLDEQVQLTDRLLFLGHYSRFHELMAVCLVIGSKLSSFFIRLIIALLTHACDFSLTI